MNLTTKDKLILDSELTTAKEQYEAYLSATDRSPGTWNNDKSRAHLFLRASAQRGYEPANQDLSAWEEILLDYKRTDETIQFKMHQKYRDGYPKFNIKTEPKKAALFLEASRYKRNKMDKLMIAHEHKKIASEAQKMTNCILNI